MPRGVRKTVSKPSTAKQKKVVASAESAAAPTVSGGQPDASATASAARGVPWTPSAPETTKVTREERHRMIAEAAYYLALKRGWNSDPLRNWLDAEKQIDEQLRREGRI